MKGFVDIKSLFLIFILILTVFLGVGLYVYFITTPQAFLRSMMKNLAKLESVNYDFQFEGYGDLAMPQPELQGLSYTKYLDKISGKAKGNIVGEIDFNKTGLPYVVDASSVFYDQERKNKYSVDLEQVKTTTDVFVRMKSFPKSEEIDLSPFKNKWVKEPGDFLEQFWPEQIQLPSDLAPEQVADLRKLISKSNLFKYKEKLGYNFFGFNLARGFKVSLDPEKTIELLKDYKLLAQGRGYTEDELSLLTQAINQISAMDIELWLGWSNKNLYRLIVQGDYSVNETKIKFIFILNLNHHNKEIEIKAPTGAMTAREILRGIGGLPQAGTRQELETEEESALPSRLPVSGTTAERERAKDVGFRDSDGDGLYDTFEFSLGTDPNNPDSDGDGMTDGEEIKEGTNPLGKGKLFEYR